LGQNGGGNQVEVNSASKNELIGRSKLKMRGERNISTFKEGYEGSRSHRN